MAVRAPVLLPLLLLVTVAFAGPAEDVRDAAQDCSTSLRDALSHVLDDDRPRAESDLVRADVLALGAAIVLDGDDARDALGRRRRSARRKARKLVQRIGRVTERIDGSSPRVLVRDLRRAVRAADGLERVVGRVAVDEPLTLADVRRGRAGLGRAGKRVTLRLSPRPGAEELERIAVRLLPLPPMDAADVVADVELLSRGRIRLTLGSSPGAAVVRVDLDDRRADYRIVNRGGRNALSDESDWGDGGPPAPAGVVLPDGPLRLRVGQDAETPTPTLDAGLPDRWTIAPPLPDGLSLDPLTGTIEGRATDFRVTTEHTLTAESDLGDASAAVQLQVAPALPEGVEELEPGFVAERVAGGLEIPVKLARAPDGRVFFTELQTGRVRILHTDDTVDPTPFATLSVLTGGESGLLGVAVSPTFGTDGHVFVLACVPAGDGKPDRKQIVRFTEVGGVGTEPTVVLDDLPVASLHNGGDLEFGPDGMLYASLGDVTDPALSQTDGALAGRVIRLAPDGSVPDDNPVPGDYEWARGFRNPFDLTFHPTLGELFATENGPTAHDELNFVRPAKNFEWGGLPPDTSLADVGLRIIDWTPVIVPTGITFHDGTAFGPEFTDNLFVCGYDAADVRRVLLSGPVRADLDGEVPFLRFDGETTIEHKPLDILQLPDGALLLSTFGALWRIRPFEPVE